LATNIILIGNPTLWNSTESDIVFTFEFKGYGFTSVTEQVVSSVGTGKIVVTSFSNWDITPVKGDYIYITGGTYAGRHRVISSTANSVVCDTPFTVAILSGNYQIQHLRVPQFSLYKGFDTGEEFTVELPLTFVTSFNYVYNNEYQIVINIKSLLKRIFKIEAPDIYAAYDFNVFNAFRLKWDTEETEYYFVLNSAITTDELNAKYISGAYYLTNVDEPLLWGCGKTFLTKFIGGFPSMEIYDGGAPNSVGFNNAFQTNQFSQGFDIL